MDLSVIIVSWNTRDLLAQCLESVYAHSPGKTFEVLVVDNASTDGSPEMVRQRFPQVKLIASEENLGFAGGNNLAIRQSVGSSVLLLNPDTEVRPGALEHLTAFLDHNPEVGAVGPYLLNPDGSLQESAYPAPTVLREFWRMFHLDKLRWFAQYPMHRWPVDQHRLVDVLMGACLLVRRSVFDQVGLLDEDYFIYSEEVDLCYRIQQAGWKLAWVPQAQVVHYGGQSTRQVAAEMFLNLYQGKILYFRKHHGWLAVQAYKAILVAASLGRLALTPLAFFERPARRGEHLTLSSHYRRLLTALPQM